MNDIDVDKLKQSIITAETEINLIKVQINEIDRNVTKTTKEKEKEKAKKQKDLINLINNYNYNRIILNLYQIITFDYSSVPSGEKANEILDQYRRNIIEANRTLPLKMLYGVLDKLGIKESDFKDIIMLSTDKVIQTNYKEEFNKLNKELADLLGDKNMSELGINDLEKIISSYSDINNKREKLFNSLNNDMINHPIFFNEKLKKELLESNSDLFKNIDLGIRGANLVLDSKRNEKLSFEEQIKKIDEDLKEVELKKKEAESQLDELKKNNNDNKEAISKKSEYIKKLEEYIENKKSIKSKINDNINILLDGGSVKNVSLDVSMPIEEIVSSQTLTPENQPTPSLTPAPSQTSSLNPAGDFDNNPIPEPENPSSVDENANTIEGLKNNGVLPKNIEDSYILYICSKLGIEVNDTKTELNNEQIDRLKNDHLIQKGLINEEIYKHNQRKIEEYDKLIAKYEMILKDKLKKGAFTQKYINKVEKLKEELKAEKGKIEAKNNGITFFDHSSIFEDKSETKYDKRATKKNKKLIEEYEELDKLRKERTDSRSKFKQGAKDRAIEKKLSKIEGLKSKQGKILSKQIEIVNENTDKYISKVTKQYSKYLEKQREIEKSADMIIDIFDNIKQRREEEENIDYDLENSNSKKVIKGLNKEKSKLERQIDSLHDERKMLEDGVIKMR